MDQFAAAALANDPSQQMQYPVPGNVVVMNHPHNFNLQYQMQIIQNFWQNQFQIAESGNYDFKNFQLPLARIKKVMKSDGDVKMIGSDAPIIFAKACEVFVLELTLRSWIHTEENKRRTLQKSDISIAISKSDMFDFLIDIVPRDEYKAVGGNNMIGGLPASAANLGIPASLAPPKIQEQFGNGGNVFYYNPGQDMQQQQQQQQQLQQQEQDDLYQQQSQQGNTSLTQYQQQRGGYF